MGTVMVTGRMSPEKKAAGARVLEKSGLNASQAINLLYDKLEEEQSASFLIHKKPQKHEWESAAKLLDALVPPEPIQTRFDGMSSAEVKFDRLKSRGLI